MIASRATPSTSIFSVVVVPVRAMGVAVTGAAVAVAVGAALAAAWDAATVTSVVAGLESLEQARRRPHAKVTVPKVTGRQIVFPLYLNMRVDPTRLCDS
jgi:hypothetical protein